MGLAALGRMAAGKETTRGTAVAATFIFMGEYSFDFGEDVNVDIPKFLDGNISEGAEATIQGRMGVASQRGTLCFEDIVAVLAAGIKGGVTGGAGDGGTPAMYSWAFAPTLTGTMDDPDTFTLEGGDDTLCEEIEYGFVRDFSISAGIQKNTEITVNWVGRQATVSSFTSLSNHTVELVSGQKWTLTRDTTGGTLGATAYGGCMRSFTFNSGPLWIPFHCQDGNLYFQAHKRAELKPELRLTLAVDSSLPALRVLWRAGTRSLWRLRNNGSIIHDAVTKRIDINMAGHITGMGPIGGAADEGVNTEEVTITGTYDSAAALLMSFTVQNKLATIAAL